MLIFLQGLLDDSHALLVRLSGSVSLKWTQLFSPKAGDPHVPIPLEDNLDFDIIMFESVTTIFYLYIPHIDVIGLPVLGKGAGLADSMLYEVISNLKRKHATTTKRAEKLVPRTQCGVIPEGGRLPHPRPAAQPDQLPLPAHTAFSCPKPFTWFEVKLFTTWQEHLSF